ncbi:hypothetical protein ACFQ2B_33265 [Streptomyces stramineus]
MARQRLLILLNRTATELLTMSLTLARAASATTAGQQDVQDLADVYCTAARARLAALLHRRHQEYGPGAVHDAVARLAGTPPTAQEPTHPTHDVTTAEARGTGR